MRRALKKQKSCTKKDYQEVSGLILRRAKTIGSERKLSDDFELNMALLGLDAREKQTRFAQMVKDDFQSSKISFLEAQAGLGKTYGYLLPLLQLAQDEQIIVSVPTKFCKPNHGQ